MPGEKPCAITHEHARGCAKTPGSGNRFGTFPFTGAGRKAEVQDGKRIHHKGTKTRRNAKRIPCQTAGCLLCVFVSLWCGPLVFIFAAADEFAHERIFRDGGLVANFLD